MIVAFFAAMMMLASIPPPGMRYYSMTEYNGPGLVCGAVFSIDLHDGEKAVRNKSNAIVADTEFFTREGRFSVHESPYATEGGKVFRKTADGVLRRKRHRGQLTFIFRDSAPGSTDVFGPALNGKYREAVLERVMFGGPRDGKVNGMACMAGKNFGEKST